MIVTSKPLRFLSDQRKRSSEHDPVAKRSTPETEGRFTGQRLKVPRPDTYRRVMELLAEPREHVPYDHICRLLCE
jgi:hypothetical protein